MIEKKIYGINCAVINTNEDTLLWLHKIGRWDEYQKLIKVACEQDCEARGIIIGTFAEDIITATYVFTLDVNGQGLDFSYGLIMFPFNQIEQRIAKTHAMLTTLGLLEIMKEENELFADAEEDDQHE